MYKQTNTVKLYKVSIMLEFKARNFNMSLEEGPPVAFWGQRELLKALLARLNEKNIITYYCFSSTMEMVLNDLTLKELLEYVALD